MLNKEVLEKLEKLEFSYSKEHKTWSKWFDPDNNFDDSIHRIVIHEHREWFTNKLNHFYYKPTGIILETVEDLENLWKGLTKKGLYETQDLSNLII